jgi:hypothetical protein
MLFKRLRNGGLLMVKAAVKEAAPKPSSCDDDGASHKDAHGFDPPRSLSLYRVTLKVFS